MSDILLYTHFKPFENKMKKISRVGSINKANLLLYIKILVSEQRNTVCEKTVEFSQFVDYEE